MKMMATEDFYKVVEIKTKMVKVETKIKEEKTTTNKDLIGGTMITTNKDLIGETMKIIITTNKDLIGETITTTTINKDLTGETMMLMETANNILNLGNKMEMDGLMLKTKINLKDITMEAKDSEIEILMKMISKCNLNLLLLKI